MPAPIVVDVGIADPQHELASALIDACSQAAAGAGTDCRLVRDAPNGPYSAIAIVTWEEGDRARVEVGLRREPTSEWRTRELTFQAADAEIERYRSVGFVIGTVATAAHDEATAAPREKEAPPPSPAPVLVPPPVEVSHPAAKAQPAPSAPPRRYGWLGIVGTIGGGLDHGGPRYGGQLWLGVRVVPHLAALVSGGASVRPRDASGLSARWLDGAVGLGVSAGAASSLHADLRAQCLVEDFVADVKSDLGAERDSRVTLGARLGADGVLPLGDSFDFVLGVDGTLRPATRVHIGGESDGATRNFELGASAGIRGEL
jgi:hypothetical protein